MARVDSEEYNRILEKVKNEYAAAAALNLPKDSWLKSVAGKHFERVKHSAEWKSISAAYSAAANDAVEKRPAVVLMKALAIIEMKIDNLEPLTPCDLSVLNMLLALSKNRQYLKLHRDRQQLEKRLKLAEFKLKQLEDSRKSDLHSIEKQQKEVTLERSRVALEHEKTHGPAGTSFFTILEPETMTEEEYRDFLGGSYDAAN